MHTKKFAIKRILQSWMLISIFFALATGHLGETRADTDPEDFCHITSHASGQYSFQGGGARQYRSTLPSQFWQQEEGRPDPIALNNHLIDQAPTQILAGTNCDTNLFGSGINPGATTVENDIANISVSAGTNAAGYAQEPSDNRNPIGIEAASNTGFNDNN